MIKRSQAGDRWFISTNYFWRSPSEWPVDTLEWIFLARAFHEIGSVMFGNHWVKQPPIALSEADPDPGLVGRQSAVIDEMISGFRIGNLISGLRPFEGGEIKPLDLMYWNTEPGPARLRFEHCQLSTKDPYKGPIRSSENSWIYVSRASLVRFTNSQPFAPSSRSIDGIRLSVYVNLMVSVATNLGLDPDNPPKKLDLINEIKNTAKRDFAHALPNGGDLSENLAKAMATLLRAPEIQLGRAKKRAK
jgi:hypothetical protein